MINKVVWLLAFAPSFIDASAHSYAEDWPMWRGIRGDGNSREMGIVHEWTTTQNVLWKTSIEGQGRSSPIVMNDSVFLTSVLPEANSRRLMRIDRLTGAVLWNCELWNGPIEVQHRFNSSASSTPATDGKFIYCIVVDDQNMHVIAVDWDGKIQWRRTPGTFSSKHGFAASPVLDRGRVLVNGHQDGTAFLVALDNMTGNEIWRYTPEIHQRSFSTPVLVSEGDDIQMIVTGANRTISLDPRTGKRIWYAEGPTEKSVSSPSVGVGHVFSFAGSPSPKGMAIRLGGQDNVTATHIAWRAERGMPYVPTPIFTGGLLHVMDDLGIYTCMQPLTGDILKRVRRGGNTYSSPVATPEHIYLFEDNGRCTVIENNANFRIVARNDLLEGTQSSPAIAHGCLFIRTDAQLWCIGKAK